MTTLVVVQSRLGSTRLPGKALLTLAGEPVLALCVGRASNTGLPVVVATSTEGEDDAIADVSRAAGAAVHRGPLDDVLGRFVEATAHLDDDDVVVRLTADNVVPDGGLVDGLVAYLRSTSASYVRVAAHLPYGLGAEAFTAGPLRAAHQHASTPADREHVTPWIRRHCGDLTFDPGASPPVPRGVRCTIDSLDDFVVARAALSTVHDPRTAPWRVLVGAWARAGGSVERLNVLRENRLGQGPWVMGTAQLGASYGAANATGVPGTAAAARMLRTAAALGATHVDAARAYGMSEARVGHALARGLAARLGVVTKLAPLDEVPSEAEPPWARAAARASVERSLRELRCSGVAAVLVHRWDDWSKGSGAVADELQEVREAGVAKVVGASVANPTELLEALADLRVGYVQMPFNLLDRRWLTDQVPEALAARPDVIVTVRSVFLQGLLAAGMRATWPTNVPERPEVVVEQLSTAARQTGRADVADLCAAYVRAQPFVTSMVLGADTVEQVRAHAGLFHGPSLTAEECALVESVTSPGSPTLVDPSTWRFS